uniref:Putative tRNA/mRNA methyltransferase n=1 Tax=Streptomyces tenjimariensis TaxID=29308 RepID=Q2UZC1_9ACTN|nr:putative tRNA/mRNA methyltransferase [Streptomyces tenjimariensis]
MFEHIRHKPPATLEQERELVIVCAPLRTKANLSSIVRTAGCCGVKRVIACGSAAIDRKVARDGADHVELELRRTLAPVLKKLSAEGYRLVALEQTSNSTSLHDFAFPRKTALVIGNERTGLDDEELKLVDDCTEIPVWGMPHSYNVATATAMAMYEYCKQYPHG